MTAEEHFKQTQVEIAQRLQRHIESFDPMIPLACGDVQDGFGSCLVTGCVCNGEAVHRSEES